MPSWFPSIYLLPAGLSVLILGTFALLAWILFRRMLPQAGPFAVRRHHRLIAQAGFLALALLVLVPVWSPHVAWVRDVNAWLARNAGYRNAVWTLLAAFAVYLLTLGAQALILRTTESLEARHKTRRVATWTGYGLFALIAALLWSNALGGAGTVLGLVGAGLALSMQETLLCFAGWLLIFFRKPFDLGDRIELDRRIGDVIDIRLFHTILLEVGGWAGGEQSTGRLMSIPNREFFRAVLYNYTKGFPFVWDEFSLVVTYESDWERAKAILLEQARREMSSFETEVRRQIQTMQREYAIHFDNLTPIVYTSLAGEGVRLTLRYLCPARKRRTMNHEISEEILHAFAGESRIDLAYPTNRMFRNSEEGKPALRPVDS